MRISKLSDAQREALRQIINRDGMSRLDLYECGIRITTVYSLQRLGLVYRSRGHALVL